MSIGAAWVEQWGQAGRDLDSIICSTSSSLPLCLFIGATRRRLKGATELEPASSVPTPSSDPTI